MKRILIIGDSCRDIYTYCTTKRLSPEKPVPVLEIDHIHSVGGMAMNVYNNMLTMLPQREVDILTNENWNDVIKERIVDKKSNHMFCRIDKPQQTERVDVFKIDYENYEYIIVSDYDKGFLEWDDIEYICSHHDKVFLDSKKQLGPWAYGAKYIKINNYEAERSGPIVDELGDKVIQTLGGDGVLWNNTIYPVPEIVETLDVSGAGDTFLASLVFKFAQNGNIIKAIKYANKQASKVVTKRGTSTP